MSLTPPPTQKAGVRVKRDNQLLLQLDNTREFGRIPEPNRSRCVSLLRKMLERVINQTPTTPDER